MSWSSPKAQVTGSQTGVTGSAHEQSVRRRRTKLTSEKKIAKDEFMAAAVGDVEWLKQSLKAAGPGVTYDKNGLAPIHLAAIHGRLDCLKTCIEKFKIDINQPSSTGWRAAHLCISNQTGKRSLQCLTYLIEQGADCSIANDDGITPVHQAASEGHVECLKLLLEANAKFDGSDCRGNTPLDLAKLWGHRKCARILAAGIWHQDKEFAAKEMLQLKKIKMQELLRELEDEENARAVKHHYEDKTCKQGRTNKKSARKLQEQNDQRKTEVSREKVYRANSVSKQQEGSKLQGINNINMSTSMKSQADELKNNISEVMRDEKLCGETEDKSTADSTVKQKNTILCHSSQWNISTHVNQSSYVPNLGDYFPRDDYTMMPQVKGAPKFYDGKFFQPLTPDRIDEDIKRRGSTAKLRKPRLPQDVINSALSKGVSESDRGMIFKCKHIEDIHIKKKFDADMKGHSEVPLHLTNDINSYLVKNSVRTLLARPQASVSKTGLSSRDSQSECTDDNLPLPLVMQKLKNMAMPARVSY